MKPNFALTLSFEGIGLLHRAFPGWHLVGEIDLGDSDLLHALSRLRDKAISLDPSGLRCKLVIPNDQIRYITFEAGDVPACDLPDLVAQHLDGATPYALNDLTFDWAENDGVVSVAAVARETLSEAEAFAAEHRFNPISFVAMPEDGDFPGEPFFGETAFASRIANGDERVERDPAPVRIIGTARIPEPETAPETAKPEPDPAAPPAAETGFSDPPATFDAPDTNEVSESSEDTPEPEAGAFTSIRAHRGPPATNAPKLDGVARHFIPAPVSARVVDDSLPSDPDSDVAMTEPEPAAPEPEPAPIPPAPPEFVPSAPPDHRAFESSGVVRVGAVSAPRYIAPPLEEQQRMTVFGAREADTIGGKPKYLALILTAVLILFLVGVAAWASIFLDDGLARFFRDDPEVNIAQVPALPDPAVQPENGDTVIAALPQNGDDAEGALRGTLSQPKPAELTDDQARARYAATGIWLIAPRIQQAPAPDSLDEFYQTSIDRDVTIQDAVALPDAADLLADDRPQTLNSPAEVNTAFQLDERGLVIATAQGALTPDGIRIYAGRPPVLPPAMPRRERVEDVIRPEQSEHPRLAAFRPKSRPGDLSEQNERSNLSGRTLNELASLRPRLRPESAQEAADRAVRQANASEATVQPFIDLDAVNSAVTEAVQTETTIAIASATPQAVASSLKPNTRPRNFETIIKQSTKRQETAVAVSATQRVTPRIPTTTSVAKQATQRNVLQMRKVNLIGVYGTPQSRRALVRLSNGRYRKVKVGDRLDGGKVSAIGDSELRYVKSGRNVVLKMPRG